MKIGSDERLENTKDKREEGRKTFFFFYLTNKRREKNQLLQYKLTLFIDDLKIKIKNKALERDNDLKIDWEMA